MKILAVSIPICRISSPLRERCGLKTFKLGDEERTFVVSFTETFGLACHYFCKLPTPDVCGLFVDIKGT